MLMIFARLENPESPENMIVVLCTFLICSVYASSINFEQIS